MRATKTVVQHRYETFADVLDRLGGIDPARVRLDPTPGRASEHDLIALQAESDRLYELVDRVLVEKVMGSPEAYLAGELLWLLRTFLEGSDLGFLHGADGLVRLGSGQVRGPDLAFFRWERVPVRGTIPTDAITTIVPDLAVEILSPGNTAAEMSRKLDDYFRAGVRLVWYIDPAPRQVQGYTAPDQVVRLTEADTLDGGDVLPGFRLPLTRLFARLPAPPAPAAAKKRPRKR